MTHSALILAALVPAAVLLQLVYRLDRIEKEPSGLLWKLLAAGALGAMLAALGELLGLRLLARWRTGQAALRLAVQSFLLVALLEEGVKYALVRLLAWKDPAFNYRFDAVVYCVFTALGFAAVENLLYVALYGFSAALSRALLSVPGHCFFAVYMGLCLAEAKQAACVGEGFQMDAQLRWSLFVPVLLHGFWDFCLGMCTLWARLLFYGFVLIFFASAVFSLRSAAENDERLPRTEE